MLPPAGLVMPLILKIDQGPQSFIGYQDNISTPAAITSIRATFRHILFPPKGDNPITPVSGLDVDFCIIMKHIITLVISIINATFLLSIFSRLLSTLASPNPYFISRARALFLSSFLGIM